MRRLLTRFGPAGFLAALVAAAVGTAPLAVGQLVPAVAPGAKKKADTKPAPDDGGVFSYPEDRDAKNQLQAARDYLDRKDIPWNIVCSVLQNILDAKSDTFFKVVEKVGGAGDTVHRISVKTEANKIIGAFPKEGLQFYQQTYGQPAAALLADAVGNGYDRAALSDVSQRYFHTKAGAEATVLLGTVYLERGNYLEAAYAFERLLGRPDSEAFLTPRTLFKAALALRRSGDPKHAAESRKVWDGLERLVARNGLSIAGKTYSADALSAELDRPVGKLSAAGASGEWNNRYGNPSRNAVVDGGTPFLDPSFVFDMLYHRREPDADKKGAGSPTAELQDGNQWVHQNLADAVRRLDAQKTKTTALPGFFPVALPNLLVFRSYDGVYAVATRDHVAHGHFVQAGKLVWFCPSTWGLPQMMASADKQVPQQWWADYARSGMVNLLFENPTIGALSHDGQYVYFVDDVALPPFPMVNDPNVGQMMPNSGMGYTGEIGAAVKSGILLALSLDKDGAVAWSLGGPPPATPVAAAGGGAGNAAAAVTPPALTDEEEDKTTSAERLCQDAIFLGPPLPANGRLYVLIERAGRMRLLCLDPRTLVPVPGRSPVPTLVWSQRLGSPNNHLPGDSVRRVQGAFPAASEGIVVCPTNSGGVIGVDAMSRSLLWAYTYRKADPNDSAPDGRGRGGRGMMWGPDGRPIPQNPLPGERWRAAAPIIAGGRVVFAAYDSEHLDCLDLRTGARLWRVPREGADLYVGGVAGDKVLVVGRDDVRAYHLTQTDDAAAKDGPRPKLVWRTKIRTPSGHGVLARSAFYVPVRPDPDQKDGTPEIWGLNTETGQITSKTTRKRAVTGNDPEQAARLGTGNLVFHEGMLFAQSPWEVAAFPQLEVKKAEMDRLLKLNPNDPRGLTDRGALLLDDGKIAEAVRDFKSAAAHDPPADVARELRQKLYTAYTELLRGDFAAAEPYLDEYRGLCDVSAPPDAEPAERQRAADESVHRKGLFLCLLATGRETQGRLAEAFDHYLAYASLGENKKLEPVYDDPTVVMRPDVWARGRIAAMVRKATDPSARKPLEDRVTTAWATVKNGSDVAKLREFVDVFGPYFPVGAEAQLKLAEALLASTNEADGREAQAHLSQLRATADDITVRARATEALARLMVKAGLLEDAVGLYAQLGKEFAAVKVRGDKTGADFFTDLLTDKRLLPYLEPSRHQWPGRVKVEQRDGNQSGPAGQAFAVEPDGELLPFYRRFKLLMDQNNNGSGVWALRVVDRVTGDERCKFTNLQPVNINVSNGGSSRFVQASGHLLLVHLGQWAYCLDLAERKERWRFSLLGEAVAGVGPPSTEIGPDGETTLRYEDGFTVTFGRSAVLQPGYVALLTRDELVALEPHSGRKLWAKKTIAPRTQVYGDGKFLLLVENGADRRPTATRLLRASDGGPVEGVKDFAKEFGAAKTSRVFGRHVLLTEGSGDGPRVARLYDAETGTDVWRKEFPKDALPVRCVNPDWVGFVTPSTGELTVLDGRTGGSVGGGRLDDGRRDEHLKGCQEGLLFHDADRFFLVLDRESVPLSRRASQNGQTLRGYKVNGPMYCFDRATGKRRWWTSTQFDNQMVVAEQFADLPVVVAAAQQTKEDGSYTYRVVVVEKETGRLRYDRGLNHNGNFFHALSADPKAAKVELLRFDLRLVISADDDAKVASAAGP